MKSILKSVFLSVCILAFAKLMPAQSFTPINPPPCDFNDQFYADNGLDSFEGSGTQLLTANTPGTNQKPAELNTEPDGRFGSFRQTGPPATGTQKNWVADPTCVTNDPTRRNFRILATTAGNSDDNNSPFTCSSAGQGPGASPGCANQPSIPETPEYISILAFIHNQNAFIGAPGAATQSHVRTVGAIGPNGGLDNQQTNPGENISITPGTDNNLGGNTTGLNPRGISMQFIVSNFEAYASLKQTLSNGKFAANPCSLGMIQNQNPSAHSIPSPCFPVGDGNVAGNTVSDVATPNLRQDWRFSTNRNAIDGSDGNCVNPDPTVCASIKDSPFGYFCDDLLGMWILTYFWFSQPANLAGISNPTPAQVNCNNIFNQIGAANGFTTDGTPIIKTAFELNQKIEANGCGFEGQEDPGGIDKGAVWLVCPALPDPRNGAIAKDAFLDAVRVNGTPQDAFLSNQFNCLQSSGKFCFEPAPEQ